MFHAIITKKNEVSNFQQRKLNDNRSAAPQLHVTPIYMDILDIQVYTNTHKGKGNTINRIQRRTRSQDLFKIFEVQLAIKTEITHKYITVLITPLQVKIKDSSASSRWIHTLELHSYISCKPTCSTEKSPAIANQPVTL